MYSRSTADTVSVLFTDIEGSTRLWEQEPGRMRSALAQHDALVRGAIEGNRGVVVKMIGDGACAIFEDALDALTGTLQLQHALADPAATHNVALRVRCGLHVGDVERRDNDVFGSVVNRAARIMAAAHGGQVLLSQAVADLVRDRLTPEVALRDLGFVRLRDLAGAEHVYQAVHPHLRRDFPPLRSLEATPNNLPQQVSSFIGRELQLTEVKRLLAATRLLTLVGAGGLGKSRLSLHVAADVVDDYQDGVWFVEFAALTDEGSVPQAVASVLGVREEAGRPMQEALVKHVKDRRLLLIMDNCEHLVRACADLATHLLQSGPDLKILASSREHLNVTGEVIYSVPTLAAPEPHLATTLEALTRYEAVRLFIERAVAAQGAFQVTQHNATAVAEICRRLDGIPLAIELAAARVRALSVEKIAAHLSDRLRLLTGGDRTALPRHQTLRALIDWSYDLLAEHERALLRRLSVFAGGWTVEGAEAVGTGSDLDEINVLDTLTRLVEKSLVTFEVEGDRYRLLETVRQYAQEHLNQSGEEDQVRTRHLAFYVTLAEKAESKLHGPDQGAWLTLLDFERENLLSAHAWCDRAERGAELGLRLVYGVEMYWPNRGGLELGHRLTIEALNRDGANERTLMRCRALIVAGQQGSFMLRYREAQVYLEESLSIAREIGDQGRTAVALLLLGRTSLGQSDRVAARGYFEEALRLARTVGNNRAAAGALEALAELYDADGNLDVAQTLYEESLRLSRELRDHGNIAVGLTNLARLLISRGSGNGARAMLSEALVIAGQIGSEWVAQIVLGDVALLCALLCQWERAARFVGALEARQELAGLHSDVADKASEPPFLARTRAALGEAAFASARAVGGELPFEAAMAEVRTWLETGSS